MGEQPVPTAGQGSFPELLGACLAMGQRSVLSWVASRVRHQGSWSSGGKEHSVVWTPEPTEPIGGSGAGIVSILAGPLAPEAWRVIAKQLRDELCAQHKGVVCPEWTDSCFCLSCLCSIFSLERCGCARLN